MRCGCHLSCGIAMGGEADGDDDDNDKEMERVSMHSVLGIRKRSIGLRVCS